MYDKDIVKNPNHKLSLWQYWYALNEETAAELLEDGYYYLLLHDDYKIPVIGRFSRACDGFIVTMVNVVISTDDPKLTHFTLLFSRDEYLEIIDKAKKELDDWAKAVDDKFKIKEENNE